VENHTCCGHGCCCGHEHSHSHDEPSLSGIFWQLGIGAALLLAAILLPLKGWLRLLAFVPAFLTAGLGVLRSAAAGVFRGRLLDETVLMSLASLGAFALGEPEEGVMILLFYRLGELFESLAQRRSRRSLEALLSLRPEVARVERPDGTLEECPTASVQPGTVLLVRPGERLPLDGVVYSGTAALDTAALTGESAPRAVGPGDEVLSGSVNLSGVLRIRVTQPFERSAVSRILELVEHAARGKTGSERFLAVFARWYTPLVVLGAAVLAVVPSVLTGDWHTWLRRGLSFLVVSCPCALVVSVPLSYFGGVGGASRLGILIKGSGCLEALADVGAVAFDKTGTLTDGSFVLHEVRAVGCEAGELLTLAALAETHSNHPLASAIRAAGAEKADPARLGETREFPGLGVCAKIDGREILVGTAALLEAHGIRISEEIPDGTAVYAAAEGRYLGTLVLRDALKPAASAAVSSLRKLGVRQIHLLTGDREAAARPVAAALQLDGCHSQLFPEDKVRLAVQLRSAAGRGRKLAVVGDGVNDAPVLAQADVGIAMGSQGTEAAMEAADVVLMRDDPALLADAIILARRTRRIVRENIVISVGIKALFLLLGSMGFVNLGFAVFADVGVLLLAVCNAMRTLILPGKGREKET